MIMHKKTLLKIAVTLIILIGVHSSAATIRRSQFEQQEINQLKGFSPGSFANFIQKNQNKSAWLELKKTQSIDTISQQKLTSAGLQINSYFDLIGFDNNSYFKQINQFIIASISSFQINSNDRETLTTACYVKATGICAALNVEIPASFRARSSVLREAILVNLPNKQIIIAYTQGKNIYELILFWLGYL